ncbi:glycosyltransferase family 9 protein [Chitinophaga lutea]
MKKILCIRPDNMGDLLMNVPAIRALRESFDAHITLLCSPKTAAIAPYVPLIDQTLAYDLPWSPAAGPTTPFSELVETLQKMNFDAAFIFTVYSQNPLPAALLTAEANIPVRVAYCRENPYQLLTHWIPEPEPYRFIRHQVQRDLDLVAHLGAHTLDDYLLLQDDPGLWPAVRETLHAAGVDTKRPWILLHPGASEEKRLYPLPLWEQAIRQFAAPPEMQYIITGSEQDTVLAAALQERLGAGAFNLAGRLDLGGFISLVAHSRLAVTVNTSTAHIAAATGTPTVVLYAKTNPQHTPWKAPSSVLYFDTPKRLRSRNEVVRHVLEHWQPPESDMATPERIAAAIHIMYQLRAAAPPHPRRFSASCNTTL